MLTNSDFFPLERNRYFYGKLLTVRDFEVEQNYFNLKRRLLNRIVQGTGVVCGLSVTVSDDTTLIIESGMALDYAGREIVIDEPLVRKLEMIDGYEKLNGRSDTYLCLAYDEQEAEPVNAVGESGSQRRFNITREGYRLFFTAQMPELRGMLEADGYENVSVLYATDELTVIISAPEAVCAMDSFLVKALIVKNDEAGPVKFKIEGDSDIAYSENEQRIVFEYAQNKADGANVIETSFLLKAQSATEVAMPLFPNGAEFNVEIGRKKYRNFIKAGVDCFVCKDAKRLRDFRRKSETLAKCMLGGQLPIYLAKIELLNATGKVFLGKLTNLPFNQEIARQKYAPAAEHELEVSTAVRELESWQKPEVRSSYNSASGRLHMDFGIPRLRTDKPQTCCGAVDIPLPSGVKVNTRVFSEEISHGLGAVNVGVRLWTEFAEGQLTHLYGSGEVFRGKGSGVKALPLVETAAVAYPERGTIRIGAWLKDDIDANLLRIHYYIEKLERDPDKQAGAAKITVSVTPEVARVKQGGRVKLSAQAAGGENKNVVWKLPDSSDGKVESDGMYNAPEKTGTYEVIACAAEDENVTASAFIIVE